MKSLAKKICQVFLASQIAVVAIASIAHGQAFRVSAMASGANEIVLGNASLGRTDGLMMRVFPPTISGPGVYRWTAQVYRADGKVFPADQELRIDLAQTGNMQSQDITTSCKVKLAQGASYAEVTFLCPTWRQFMYWKFFVYRDGRELTGFSNSGFNMPSSSYYSNTGNQSLVVLEDDTAYARYMSEFPGQLAAEFRQLDSLPQSSLSAPAWHRIEGDANNNITTTAIALASRLPENWLEYTHCRWVWIQSKSLGRLNPAQTTALRQYVAGGGVLVVTQYDLTDLSPLQKFLNAPTQLKLERAAASDNAYIGATTLWGQWLHVDSQVKNAPGITAPGMFLGQPVQQFSDTEKLAFDVEEAIDHPVRFIEGLSRSLGLAYLDRQLFEIQMFANANRLRKSTDPTWISRFQKKSDSGQEFVDAYYGMGVVIATDLERLATMPKTFVHALEIRNASRLSWSMRGTDINMGSGDNYWSWMIPEVGKPPVWWFMFFIILFAAIVGPLLMWYTYRSHRQTWLLILFPIIAVVVTSVLLLFAILHDGFETISRIRSFTWYDATNDTGFSWSRQTYFSGMPPREGLQVGTKTEVTPFRLTTNGYSYESIRAMHSWSESGQSYRNMLGSREQRQFLLRHPIEGAQLFKVDVNTDESGAPKITNTSNDRWLTAMFVDAKGIVWTAENTDHSQTVNFNASDSKTVIAKLAKLSRESGPSLPPGFIQGQQLSIFGWLSNRFPGRWSTSGDPLMETEIVTRMTNQNSIVPNSFLIVMENAPHIERPTKVDRTSPGFHAVGGVW
jgi:hypothetical protein